MAVRVATRVWRPRAACAGSRRRSACAASAPSWPGWPLTPRSTRSASGPSGPVVVRPAPDRRPVPAAPRPALVRRRAPPRPRCCSCTGWSTTGRSSRLLRRSLRRCGFGQVRTVNYSVFTSDIRTAAADPRPDHRAGSAPRPGTSALHVGRALPSAAWSPATTYSGRAATPGCTPWSPSAPRMAAPWSAQVVGRVLPLRLCRQLRPDSDVIAELAEPAPGCRTRFLAAWSDLDQLIYPKTSARIDHPDLVADNVLVLGLGHMSLPAAAEVARRSPAHWRTTRPAPGHRGHPAG